MHGARNCHNCLLLSAAARHAPPAAGSPLGPSPPNLQCTQAPWERIPAATMRRLLLAAAVALTLAAAVRAAQPCGTNPKTVTKLCKGASECCSKAGYCGTGPRFCAPNKCYSGACLKAPKAPAPRGPAAPAVRKPTPAPAKPAKTVTPAVRPASKPPPARPLPRPAPARRPPPPAPANRVTPSAAPGLRSALAQRGTTARATCPVGSVIGTVVAPRYGSSQAGCAATSSYRCVGRRAVTVGAVPACLAPCLASHPRAPTWCIPLQHGRQTVPGAQRVCCACCGCYLWRDLASRLPGCRQGADIPVQVCA